jgi:hypothetical protein
VRARRGRALSGAVVGARAPNLELDHLVVGAASLEVGRDWCERIFGVAAQPGGRHLSMATHNVLLSIVSPRFPKAYLEIIAIDPDVAASQRARWFDLDDAAVRDRVAVAPTLLHWVARIRTSEADDDIDAALVSLRAVGHDPGDVADSERATATGMLRWRITLPRDGRRPAGGAVPLLIAWGQQHPTDSLPASGVEIESLRIGGVEEGVAATLGTASDGVDAPPLAVTLRGPLGVVVLAAPRVAR